MDPAIAEKITEYREKHGPFERIGDIMKARGIAEGRFVGMKGKITVGD